MSSSIQPSSVARPADALTLVTRHKSYRGLTVEQNLLDQFTMYIVDLDHFGLCISDSRPEAIHMAFEALFMPKGNTHAV